MAKQIFLWNTLDPSLLRTTVKYIYQGEQANDLDSWDPTLEELVVSCELDYVGDEDELLNLTEGDETLLAGMFWRADRKFTGSTPSLTFVPGEKVLLECSIPPGFCTENLTVSIHLFTGTGSDQTSQWTRPPGSMLSEKKLFEHSFDNGNLFPIFERDGDGKVLLRWDFDSVGNLEESMASALSVFVDRKHILAGTDGKNVKDKEFLSLLTLRVVQGLAHKALSDSLFSQITESGDGKLWNDGSIGGTLYHLLNNVRDHLHLKDFDALMDTYKMSFEVVEAAIDELYSEAIKTSIS